MASTRYGGDDQPPGQRPDAGYRRLLDNLRQGHVARLLPLLGEAQTAAHSELRKSIDEGRAPSSASDSLATLAVARSHVIALERRWQQQVGAAFSEWPRHPARVDSVASFSLVSDDQLQTQLIGQPLIEALDRRFADILDVIDRRLLSLATALGAEGRPGNPFLPRVLIDAFLVCFPSSECDAPTRGLLLGQYERLAYERLGDTYAWCNSVLADSGLDMGSTRDHALLAATSVASQPQRRGHPGVAGQLGTQGSLTPRHTDGMNAVDEYPRGDRLRKRAMRRHQDDARRGDGRRELGEMEFLAVLSLLHWEGADSMASGKGIGDDLRESIAAGAAQLGMHPEDTMPSLEQETAIDLVGNMLEALIAGHRLQPDAESLIAGLAPVYLRLAIVDPALFESPLQPALEVLSSLVALLDSNQGRDALEIEMLQLANQVAAHLVEQAPSDGAVFTRAQERVRTAVAPP